ncbi:slipin family protein [Chitinophaga sedimenti]|uniref:slipin family protein n=1 Tax=Chitinophaga sedimenti TaxID=2033606 RepID=UPI002003C070|nr:slipin family protein [Chitinophaga sedimenti]MCK7558392.1 slipin family protein [Chitinophaga sedimenti]
MKRLIVNKWQIAVVFRNKTYHRILTAGTHWLRWDDIALVYQMNEPYNSGKDLDVMLQDEMFRNAVHLVEVKDNELVLVYENGILKQVLTTGRYTYWKGLVEYRFERMDISKADITEEVDRSTLGNKLLSAHVRSATVSNHEKGLLFIDGKYVQLLEPGVYHWWNGKMSIQVAMADTRQLQAEISGQEILTKDKATLRINARAQYRLSDIQKAMLDVKDYDKQLHVRLQLALRETVGELTLDELMERKNALDATLLSRVNTGDLGISVSAIGIRDIILPGDMREIMNQVLMAEKRPRPTS